MSAQQLLLSWKDHNGALVSVFENLLKRNTFVDCTLAAEGQYLKAHKVVLSACSSYFELLLSQETERNPIVILKDVKFQELEAAVNFMYRGEVEVCEDRLAAFLEVADSLQIKGLGSNEKSEDSKEKVSSVKSSSAKSAFSQRQQSRKEDLNRQSDNAGRSSNVAADCEQINKFGSSSVQQSSRRGNSPNLTVSTFSVGPSSSVRKDSHRDLDSLENIQQSLVVPSSTSGESVQCEENPIIKIEPETDTFAEDQSDEGEGDFGDDVAMMDDKDDWDEPHSEIMDAVQTNQQDIDYPSQHMKTDDGTSENVEGVQPGNQSQSSLEGAVWIQSDDQQNFSSIFLKEEPGTSASWNQDAVACGVSASSAEAGTSARTSAASAGVDSLVIEDNEHLTPGSVQFYPPLVGSSRSEFSVRATDEYLQRTTGRLPSKKFFCPRFFCSGCKKVFIRMVDLRRHLHSQSCSALPSFSEGEVQLDDPSLGKIRRLKELNRKSSKHGSYKCSECDYVTPIRSHLNRHFRIHTGQKPFKCQYCDYASGRKDNLVLHSSKHTGEKPFKCQHCDYATALKCNLLVHLRTHTGEQRFECRYCKAKFRSHMSLMRHLRCACH